MAKLKDAVMFLCFFLLIMIISGYTYLSQIDGIYVNKPIEFHYWDRGNVITHQTTKLVYHPGEMVYAKIISYKIRIWPAVLQWNLTSGCLKQYPTRPESLEAGIIERIVAAERVALDAPPGEECFYGSATFDLNFIRQKIHIPLRTNTFMVLMPEKQ